MKHENPTESADQSVALSHEKPSNAHDFFVICTPGLEHVTSFEIKNWFPSASPRAERGGVAVAMSLGEGLALNRVLKTATRVLLRLAIFGCRDFPKLFKKVSGFPWEEWLDDRADVEFNASTHGSRLKMKKRIEETCRDGRIARLKKRGRPHGYTLGNASVYVRIDDDVCVLSLDTSGEILHKRGTRVLTADAPLRETIAAALLLLFDLEDGGSSVKRELVDPMTGAGTFLIEAAGLSKPVGTRAFAFEKFIGDRSVASVPSGAGERYSRLIGFDLDAKAAWSARENLRKIVPAPPFEIFERDFFTGAPLPEATGWRGLIANPPYDERIEIRGRPAEFFEKLFAASERVASPDAACFIVPEKIDVARLRIPTEWLRTGQQRFSNGGIPVVALSFRRAL